jgi:hypothetical protein
LFVVNTPDDAERVCETLRTFYKIVTAQDSRSAALPSPRFGSSMIVWVRDELKMYEIGVVPVSPIP